MWDKIKSLVGTVAPTLGTALGGPLGGMAGQFLADTLGVPKENLEETVLNANPDTMLKIKEADQAFKLKMKELDITEEQLHAKDRDSARNLAIKTSIYPQIVQSVMYDIGFILAVIFVFTYVGEFTKTQENIIMFLLGILSAGLVQVNNFWFGSSSGSKEKTNIMGNK
jgi:hypothetical protein